MTNFRYYQFDDFLLDAEEGVLYRNNEPVPLTRKVFDLLLLLVRSDGRVLYHDEIIQTLWSETSVEQANLKQSIYLLRRALDELPDENKFIKTLPKRGYRFLPEVKALPDEKHSMVAAERLITDVFIEAEIIEEDENDRKDLPLLPAHRPFLRQSLVIVFFCLLLLMSAVYGFYRYTRAKDTENSPVSLENASWQKLTNSGKVHYAGISPNGEFIVYIGLHQNNHQSISLLKVDNRSEMTVVPPEEMAIWGFTFSPDSSQIYYTARKKKDESKAERFMPFRF